MFAEWHDETFSFSFVAFVDPCCWDLTVQTMAFHHLEHRSRTGTA